MASSRTIVNALIGAVVGIVLSFIPFSTVVGGAAAGFLEGPDGREGALAGALAGLIAFVPVAAIAFVALGVFGFALGAAALPVEGFAFVALAVLTFATLVFLYTVGLSALGGYLGAFLAREYPSQHARTRRSLGAATRSSRDGPAASGGTRGSREANTRTRERGDRFGEDTDSYAFERGERRDEATDGATRSDRGRNDERVGWREGENGDDRADTPPEATRWHEKRDPDSEPDADGDSLSDLESDLESDRGEREEREG